MSFPIQGIDWNDERVATLKAMWDEGLSSSKIALAIGEGCTRSAVCGKVHRLKLSDRAKRGRHAAPKPKPVKDYRRPSDPQMPVLAVPVTLVPVLVSMEDISDQMCRWPIGDPALPDFRFCGCLPIPRKPYCVDHAATARQPKLAPTQRVDVDGEPVQSINSRGKLRPGQTHLWR